MGKHKTIKTILCFILTAAVSLPSFGCAYERAKGTSEPSKSVYHTMETMVISPDPKDAGTKKSSKDLFYTHDVTKLEAPDVKKNGSDVCLFRDVMETTFLDKVLLVHESGCYCPASTETVITSSSYVVGDDTGDVVFPQDTDDSYYVHFYAIYDFNGNLLGKIDSKDSEDIYDIGLFQNDNEGNILYIFEEYDNAQQARFLCVEKYSQKGEYLNEKHQLLRMESEGEIERITGALFTKKGELLISTYSRIYMFDQDYRFTDMMEFESDYANSSLGMSKEDDDVFIALAANDGEEMTSQVYSFSKMQRYTESVQMNAANLSSMLVFQSNSGFYAMTKNTLGKLSLKSGEFRQVIDWNQVDVDRCILNNSQVKVIRDGQLGQPVKMVKMEAAATITPAPEQTDEYTSNDIDAEILLCHKKTSEEGTELELIHIYEADTNPHDGKTVIWMGGVDFSDENFCKAVTAYNSDPSNDSWIKITDYSDFSPTLTYDDQYKQDQAVEALYAQMLSGSGPDIIYGLGDYKKFDKSRLLTDLNPYMDSLNGIDRTDYFETILNRFETDGKLFQIPVSFKINALLWNPYYLDYLSNDHSIAGMTQTFYSIPEDDDLYMMMTVGKQTPYQVLVRNTINNRVNYGNGEINLSDDDLAYLLEITAMGMTSCAHTFFFGDNESWLAIDGTIYNEITPSVIMPISINSMWKYLSPTLSGLYMTGYPNASSEGYVAQADISLGIASYSTNKEKAWYFIRYMLSEEVQSNLCFWTSNYKTEVTSGIPINQTVYTKFLSENVGKAPADYYIPSLENSPASELRWDGVDVSMFVDFILQADTRFVRDATIEEIIADEAGQYANDEKSIFEAVASLRDRIKAAIG